MTADLPLLDPDPFARIRAEIGDETAQILKASFRAELEGALETLPVHAAAGDRQRLDIMSHALKSTARTFGAMALGQAAEAVEQAAMTGAVPDDAMARLCQVLRATLGAMATAEA